MSSIMLDYSAFDGFLAMLHHVESIPNFGLNSAKKMQTYLKEIITLLCKSYAAREIFLQNGGNVSVHINDKGNIVKFDDKDVKEFEKI